MLQVRLLGQFEAYLDDQRISIPSRAGQSLFAYLLLNPGVGHRREKLAGLLWPDTTDDNARRSLRQELWRIRKAVQTDVTPGKEYLLTDDVTVALNAGSDYWLDVAQLERGARGGDSPERLAEALALYRGELLPGFYDDWAVLERERLQALFDDKMERLLEEYVQAERWNEVRQWGERWIALGHTPEPAYRALMLAYAASGDMSKMGTTYLRCVDALHKELGVGPSEVTRTLYERLARGEHVVDVSFASVKSAAVRRSVLPAPDEPPAPGEPPFKGLQYFDETDADLFFGREELTAHLVQRLHATRFLAIIGASGSGKSSSVRAGVAASLAHGKEREQSDALWRVFILTPTAHPLEALATTLTREAATVTETAALTDELAREPRMLRLFLRRLTSDGRQRTDDRWQVIDDRQPSLVTRRVLIVIDQFEELFTLCRDEFEREAFVDNLLAAIAPTHAPSLKSGDSDSIRIILTLRADFYEHCAQYADLRACVAANQEYIGPMNAEELRSAIEQPATRNNWEFEAGLVDLIVRDVGDEPGALPLLSHALLETWKRRSGRALTLKGYADAGGVRGAISRTAERVFNQELTPDQQAIARNIFLRLTELGEGTEDTRRRAAISELVTRPEDAEQVRAVLTQLADARLITTGEGTAEVAHEALIREWQTLREWLMQDREGLRLHRHLTEAGQEWEALERDPGALYRGARLAQAAEFAVANPNTLNELERTFLQASEVLEQKEIREKEDQQRRELEAAQQLAAEQKARAEEQTSANKRLRQRALLLAGALLLALVLAGLALILGDQARTNAASAQREERLATARELAANATGNLEIDPERSILLGLKAIEITAPDQTVLPEAQEVLHRAIQNAHVEKTLIGHTDIIWEVAYSPDGTRIVTSGWEGKIIVWDAQTGKELFAVPMTEKEFFTPSFSPDGSQLATFDGDVKSLALKLWDGHTGAPLRQVPLPPPLTVNDGLDAFSPDWSRVAVAAASGPTRVFDMQTGAVLLTLGKEDDSAIWMAWSPDGKQIAGTIGNTVKVWDAQTGRELYKLPEYGALVRSVAYSPDSKYLATVSSDQTGDVWDAATGKELFKIEPHSDALEDIAFSPDGKRLAVTTDKREIILYDAANGQELDRFRGHAALIHSVAFSPDGKHLASVSDDHTGKIWSLAPTQEINTLVIPSSTGTIALSADGTRLLSAQEDNTVKVYDAANGKELMTLEGHTGAITVFDFSPDQSKILSASADKTARVWDAVTGKELLRLNHADTVTNAAFSPDGKLVATGSNDGTAKLWDAGTGKELHTFTTSHTNWGGSAIAFSPDGTMLAVGTQTDQIGLWRIADFKETMTLQRNGAGGAMVQDLRFARDGKRLVEASQNGIVHVWDVAGGKEVRTLTGHEGRVSGVHISADGKFILTDGIDATHRLWDATTGKLLLTFYDYQNANATSAFSPDGKRILIGEKPGARWYTLDPNELVQIAKSKLTRTWTLEECQKYLHLETCSQ